MRLRGCVAAAVLTLSLLGPASAHGQAPPAIDVTPGTTYDGQLAVLHQSDRYQLRAPVTGVVRIRVDHTNRHCEVWATLGDANVGSIEQNYVPADGVTIEDLVVETGVYVVVIDTGPIRPCAGADYSLSVEYIHHPTTAPRARGRTGCDAFCQDDECLVTCHQVAKLNTLIRKVHHEIHTSRGAARRRAIRHLRALQRGRNAARLRQKLYCGG